MSQQTPKTIYLKDYTPPDYLIDQADLRFELDEAATAVHARLSIYRNPASANPSPPLVLDGQELKLLSLTLDGETLPPDRYRVDEDHLTIFQVPETFVLETMVRIHPEDNTSLEGLYQSSGNFCTQCEAEGFRKITYYLDRPDVMARFTTTLVADQLRYPVMLSNGNPVESGKLADGRHWVKWEDPFKKPAYLFALVAGRLKWVEDTFTTRSGRVVALRLYVEPENIDQCEHALRSLKKAMAWDEQAYGLEYDLDTYMIVAVGDFNMGAMENKGLNIFNTRYVLARPQTATDTDYQGIEAVIGHEYFHNWTGNRVTCRDWFQLSLKEGLTVFREQEFSADMGSPGVSRIDNVRALRARQFPEDAGPMAHPVRPESYIEINNFYTPTVYEKGAEVIRMLQTLLGKAGFRRGMDLYFQRHDGQAVTCDDFVAAMADANDADLDQFRRWYSQAGTPELTVDGDYDPHPHPHTYTLSVRQSCPSTPGQHHKLPLHIPLTVGLLDREGRDLPLQLEGEEAATAETSRLLELRQTEQVFRFVNVSEAPVASLLRGFSAPVRLNMESDDAELSFRLARDGDDFNRWEAGQQLVTRTVLKLISERRQGRVWQLAGSLGEAFGQALADPAIDRSLLAQILTLPGESYLAEQMDIVDVDGIHEARNFIRRTLAQTLYESLLDVYQAGRDQGPYRIDAQAIGWRSLKNRCLDYLVQLDDLAIRNLCLEQYGQADNMSDEISAVAMLANLDCPEREQVLTAFYARWQHEPLVVDKWFALQATSPLPDTLARVRLLLHHPAFNIKNPNKVRALIGAFCQANPVRFHEVSGAGYAFLADQVLVVDALNPQIAARLLGVLSHWRRYDIHRQELMKSQLERILKAPKLSPDVYEVATKSLGDED